MAQNAADKIRDALEGIVKDKKTLVRILSIVVILLIAAVMRIHDSNKADITLESAEPAADVSETEDVSYDAEILVVDISGAVNEPGVYQVDKGTRLYQVIEMAGGLSEDADTDSVNRASYVEDGQKIIIPVKGSETPGTVPSSSSGDQGSGLININTASLDELKTLNGIGDVIAQRIIDHRNSHAFKSIEDIMSVEGIGNKMFEKIKDRITV